MGHGVGAWQGGFDTACVSAASRRRLRYLEVENQVGHQLSELPHGVDGVRAIRVDCGSERAAVSVSEVIA